MKHTNSAKRHDVKNTLTGSFSHQAEMEQI